MTVVPGALLLPMHRALRAVQVQDQTPGQRMRHRPRNPGCIQRRQPGLVVVRREDPGLKAPHRIPGGGPTVTRASAHHQAHRRVSRQAVGVIRVRVSGEAAVDRLPDQRHQVVLHIAPQALPGQKLTRHPRQPQLLIQLPVREQAGVRTDLAPYELQPHPSVELQAQRLLLAFTPGVPPAIPAAMTTAVRLRPVSWPPYPEPPRPCGQCGPSASRPR